MAAPLAATAASPPAYPEVVFILDASGSMWGQAGGQSKIEAAKEVMAKAVPALPGEVRLGLVAYGHRKKGRLLRRGGPGGAGAAATAPGCSKRSRA